MAFEDLWHGRSTDNTPLLNNNSRCCKQVLLYNADQQTNHRQGRTIDA
jgi:hypothetical protein